jgi:hypothetical protein
MQGNARSELAERWDLEALLVLDFEQMLFREQTPQDCRVARRQFDSCALKRYLLIPKRLPTRRSVGLALAATLWPLRENYLFWTEHVVPCNFFVVTVRQVRGGAHLRKWLLTRRVSRSVALHCARQM